MRTMMQLYVSMEMYLCFLETPLTIMSIILQALLVSILIINNSLPLMCWNRAELPVLSLNQGLIFRILQKESLQLPERVILVLMEVLQVGVLDLNLPEKTNLFRKIKESKL